MFIDEVILTCRAGKWWDGAVSWRREKYIPKGGPFWGDGGNGGNVILRATSHETTLIRYRHAKVIKAAEGERWATQEMHGATAEDTILEVPVGTIVTDVALGTLIVDLTTIWQEYVLCQGGRGGFGNAHFPSSTRQAPNFAEVGDIGSEREVKMELKLVADVGLVGLPNAGKSTVIQSITNVKPKIANYAFTTLIPNLWVMEHKWRSLVIEDVPGLIEGASEGKGLGTQFLKHIDRCHIIIHLIDASQGEDEIIEAYRVIRGELEKWSPEMWAKEEVIVFSKADIIDPEMLEEMRTNFEKATGKKVALTISAGAYIRIDALKDLLIESIPEKKRETVTITEDEEGYIHETREWWEELDETVHVYDLKRAHDPKRFSISRIDENNFEVKWERIEEIVRMTNMQYTEWVNRVYNVMEKLGIIRKIKGTLVAEMEAGGNSGFFEGEEDRQTPNVWISGRKFSLENVVFMKEDRE
jgi:GTPase